MVSVMSDSDVGNSPNCKHDRDMHMNVLWMIWWQVLWTIGPWVVHQVSGTSVTAQHSVVMATLRSVHPDHTAQYHNQRRCVL